MSRRSILLIISGSIAAYKALELVRELRRRDYQINTVLTKGAGHFITPLAVSALSGTPTYTDLFSLKDETEMGHIRLAREHDAILIAPVSADRIASMASGRADDLAAAILLAADYKHIPVLCAPAMNPAMWNHPATRANVETIRGYGVKIIEPHHGLMACGEEGAGRFADIIEIITSLEQTLDNLSSSLPLKGKHIVVTGGATREPIDAVRFISNHSSGKQAVAIAQAALQAGAKVTFVHGALEIPPPSGSDNIPAITAESMLKVIEDALPADIAICAAAVADWQAETPSPYKMKKKAGEDSLTLHFRKTPDILQYLSTHPRQRPELVIGFAAETGNVVEYATQKKERKGCDWIIANDVSDGAVFGEDTNKVHLLTRERVERWPSLTKHQVAQRLIKTIAAYYTPSNASTSNP